MATMLWNKPVETRGASLIRAELERVRGLLQERQKELDAAKKQVAELALVVGRLEMQISDLEHDDRALHRGYIAVIVGEEPTKVTGDT